MKPISECPDDELIRRNCMSNPEAAAVADEVLRLRALRLADERDLDEAVRVQMEQRARAESAEGDKRALKADREAALAERYQWQEMHYAMKARAEAAEAEVRVWQDWADEALTDARDRAEAAETDLENYQAVWDELLNEVNEARADAATARDRQAEALSDYHRKIKECEALEENLAFAQQRAADKDLRARLGEDKIRALVEHIRELEGGVVDVTEHGVRPENSGEENSRNLQSLCRTNDFFNTDTEV